MIKHNTSYKIFSVVIFTLLIHFGAQSQTYTELKRVKKSFKVNAATTVDIQNKYGKIDVIPWDTDSVTISVSLSVHTDEVDQVGKIVENIDFDFSGSQFYINASTKFGNNYSSFLHDLKNIAESDHQMKIDYTIKMPTYVNLIINNKYGDVFVDELKGNLSMNLQNGNFKAENLSGNAQIDIKFGYADIGAINIAKMDISYCELALKTAKQLDLISKYSQITIEHINLLKTNTKRDKFFITTSDYVYGETYFSEIAIAELQNEVSMDMKYGNLVIEQIKPTFTNINLSAKHTDIKLTFNSKASFEVELTYEKADIETPESNTKLQNKQVENMKGKYITFGKIGTGNTTGKLRVNAEGRSVIIQHK